ncbi:L-seryl-tRNA(Sec) selenium transferase [Campylobacter majalis]|uniref:L-seryl-tRNA(Sec) selenium transferase n=1 Tax=Campylobacter majalis TaxID=2790656 RepID=UPI003D699E4C
MYKNLPQIDKILSNEKFSTFSKPILAKIAREVIQNERVNIQNGKNSLSKDEIIDEISNQYEKYKKLNLQKLINATGIIMHTNLGRSVIHREILNRASDAITSYTNLEYDLTTSSRANRYDYIGSLLSTMFGCDDALVVNNNAAAVFLILNTLAKNAQIIVSRGELVEIGGGFRVPEVMSSAGAALKEVGTTNKTNEDDYINAINENTKMIFKAHRSNFDMVGFTQSVKMSRLSQIAKEHDLIDYYDLGSASAIRLNHNLDKNEESISELIKSGVSLISFSGDKLFGSVQCGIVLGKKELIKKLKANQLMRMLRVDKITLAILSESIKAYLNEEIYLINTPYMINKTQDELENLAHTINQKLKKPLKIITSKTYVGGGSLPNKQIPTIALSISGNAIKNEAKYRNYNVIGRVENDEFILDLRSLLDNDVEILINIINKVENE